MKSGFIGIIGRPNVGKSTLMNALVGEKIAITTEKPQTTRNQIRGILNTESGDGEAVQMVFIDTPGIHNGKNKLGKAMTETAISAFREADLVLFITDDFIDRGPGDRNIISLLNQADTPKLALINKTDTMSPEKYLSIYREYEELKIFDGVYGISALEGNGVNELLPEMASLLPDDPAYFPSDMLTDRSERFMISEIIREKLLEYLSDEVPHGTAVQVERFEELDNRINISCVIYCEKKSHKAIIIGKGGRKLKGVGKAARKEFEALLGIKIYLQLWVKVRENWRDREIDLLNLGYRKDKI